MNITKVNASNFKGRRFSHALHPFTLITGGNAAGKTAITDAITVALAGFLPKLGKRNQDTYRLASGGRMAVGVEFSDGSQLARTYTESRGSVKAEASSETTFPAYLLDAAEYFSLSDRERMKLVFRIAPGLEGAVGLTDVTARLKGVVLAENTKDTETTLAECCKIAEQELVKANAAGQTMQEWLEALVVALKAKLTEANAAAKRMTGTVAGLTEIGRESVQFSERELKEAQARHSEAQRNHQTASNAVTKAKQDAGRMEMLARQILAAQEAMASGPEALAENVTELRRRVAGYESQTGAIQEALKGFRRQLGEQKAAEERMTAWQKRVKELEGIYVGTRDLAATITTLQATIETLEKSTTVHVSTFGECKLRVDNIKAASLDSVLKMKDADRRGDEKQAKLDALLKNDCCPTCQAVGSEWKARITEACNADIEDCRREALGFLKQQDALIAEGEAASAVLETAAKADAAHFTEKGRLAQFRKDMAGLKNEQHARETAFNRWQDSTAAKPSEPDTTDFTLEILDREAELKTWQKSDAWHASLRAELEQAEAKQSEEATRSERLASLKGELAGIQAGDPHELEAAAMKAWQAVLDAGSDVERLTLRQRQSDAAKAEQMARMKALEAAKTVEAEVAACKAAVATIEDLQHDLVAKAFGALLAVANRIAAPVLRSPLEYRDGEIGRQDGRYWVTSKTFSGTEQAVTYAAFAVALAAGGKMKLCVVDEIGRLDTAHRAKLFAAVRGAVDDGTIAQFIGIIPELDAVPEGAAVIEVK